MEKLEDIISDEELDNVFGEANFGDRTKRQVIKETLLKCVCGYASGRTATYILLVLINILWKIFNQN